MSRRIRNTRSAFATVVVILVLGLVTTALSALVIASRLEHLQTQAAVTEARLRQLEMAATIDAVNRAAMWNQSPQAPPWTMTPPDGTGSAKGEILDAKNDQMHVRLTCAIGENHLTQVLRFARTDSKWAVVEVQTDEK